LRLNILLHIILRRAYLVSTNADPQISRYIQKYLLLNSEIDIVVLVTSDGGFTPDVKDLKNAGKKVWVIYKNKPSHKLMRAADRCIPWSDLKVGNTSSPVASRPPFRKQAQRKPQKQQPLALTVTMTSA
jgi:hypothetical protein